MSEPKRYKLRPIFWDYCQLKSVSKDQIDAMGNESAYSHKDGDWVKYEDYARLKEDAERYRLASLQGDVARLENARLKAECQARQAENSVLAVECDSLKAEVERLTKAGDAMAIKINVHGINDRFTDSQKLVDDWSNAAKGVQS
jgi:hypothetical protein